MATQPGVGQGKAEFLEQLLRNDAKTNIEAVNRAWNEAGNEGSISESYLSKSRAKLGMTKPRGKAKPAKGSPGKSQPKGTPGRRRAGRPPVAEEISRASANGMIATAQSAPTAKQGETEDRDRALEDLEAEIDRLMFRVMGIGGLEGVEQSLRMARRVVTREIRE